MKLWSNTRSWLIPFRLSVTWHEMMQLFRRNRSTLRSITMIGTIAHPLDSNDNIFAQTTIESYENQQARSFNQYLSLLPYVETWDYLQKVQNRQVSFVVDITRGNICKAQLGPN